MKEAPKFKDYFSSFLDTEQLSHKQNMNNIQNSTTSEKKQNALDNKLSLLEDSSNEKNSSIPTKNI